MNLLFSCLRLLTLHLYKFDFLHVSATLRSQSANTATIQTKSNPSKLKVHLISFVFSNNPSPEKKLVEVDGISENNIDENERVERTKPR